MPIYEYSCRKCHGREELLQKLDEEPPEICSHCGAKNTLTRVVSESSFQLKGGGWYKDLYASKKTSPAGESDKKGDETKKEDKKDDKKGDKKND
ncbi:MAG TPA: zinc ribbon domain-containing protein [Myxococcota bacterium]|nr:zinc ribbon domain-containing protein [Myxococcota bacterium]